MFKGSFVAIVTPFKDGEVDLEKLTELVEWHIESGTHGIVPCGTTGESPTLSHEEHAKVVEHVIKTVNKRIPVFNNNGFSIRVKKGRIFQRVVENHFVPFGQQFVHFP